MPPTTNIRRVATLCAGALGFFGHAAHGQLAPFALAVSETVTHQSNLFRDIDALARADWVTTTGVKGEFDGLLGRQHLKAAASMDFDRYRRNPNLDYNSPRLVAEMDWSTAGLLAGELGADWVSSLYQYGVNGGIPSDGKNIQKNSRVFSRVHQGGITDWTLLAGLEGIDQQFSLTPSQDARQWSGDAGAKYQASPDLAVSGTVRYANGQYPHFNDKGQRDNFDRSGLDMSSTWVVSGASTLDAVVGYTVESHSLQGDRKYWTGSARWTWVPSARLKFSTGLHRDGNASTAVVTTDTVALSLYGKILNSGADLSAAWDITSKINLAATASMIHRQINDSSSGSLEVQGSDNTNFYRLGARYLPTQAVELACDFSRETRRTSASLPLVVSRPYSSNILNCGGTLWLR